MGFRNLVKLFLILLMPLMLFDACVTPKGPRKLSRDEIIKLTTCHTPAKKIATNLKLLGYEVRAEKGGVLSTNFIQVSGHSDSKTMQKIIVTPQSRTASRFKIRVKSEETETYKDDSRALKFRDLTFGDTGTSKTKIKTSEVDLEYWSDHIQEYKDTQKDVCN